MNDIHSRVPVNKTAALVVSKGFEYQPEKIICRRDQDCPIPTRDISKNINIENLAGLKFGRFTVIGLARDVPKRWVVRCSCGTYSIRTAKAIKSEGNYGDRCDKCKHIAYLRKRDIWQSSGLEVDERDL